MYLGKRQQYGIIRNKLSERLLTVKVKKPQTTGPPEFEEIEVDIIDDEVHDEVDVKIRVVISEEKRFTLKLKRPSNEKLKVLAEQIGDIVNLTRYELTFFYKTENVGLNERIGDRDIGGILKSNNHSSLTEDTKNSNYLLCLKGGAQGPKVWKRFTTTDDPCR